MQKDRARIDAHGFGQSPFGCLKVASASFGCGEMDHYTFFDDCFLRAMPMASDFPSLGGLAQTMAWNLAQKSSGGW